MFVSEVYLYVSKDRSELVFVPLSITVNWTQGLQISGEPVRTSTHAWLMQRPPRSVTALSNTQETKGELLSNAYMIAVTSESETQSLFLLLKI